MRWQASSSTTHKVLEAAERDGAALGMDRSIQQDNHTMWQGQIRDVAPRFRLPSVVPLPPTGHSMMPRQMGEN